MNQYLDRRRLFLNLLPLFLKKDMFSQLQMKKGNKQCLIDTPAQ